MTILFSALSPSFLSLLADRTSVGLTVELMVRLLSVCSSVIRMQHGQALGHREKLFTQIISHVLKPKHAKFQQFSAKRFCDKNLQNMRPLFALFI